MQRRLKPFVARSPHHWFLPGLAGCFLLKSARASQCRLVNRWMPGALIPPGLDIVSPPHEDPAAEGINIAANRWQPIHRRQGAPDGG